MYGPVCIHIWDCLCGGEGVEDIRRVTELITLGWKLTHEGREGGTSVLRTWGRNGSDHGAREGLGDTRSDNQYHHGQGYIGIHNLSLVSEDTRVWSCVTSGMSGTSHDSCVVGDLQRWMREIDHPHPRPILYFPTTLALTITCPRPSDDKVTRCANDRGHLDWPWPSLCD